MGRAGPLIVSSSAKRCLDTSRLIFGDNAARRLLPVPSLYDGLLQPGHDNLFDNLGYAPLRPYMDAEGGEDLLDAYAEAAMEGIAQALVATAPADGGDPDILARSVAEPWVICCHAIYTNRLCLMLATALDLPDCERSVPLDTDLGETDGFLVLSDQGTVTLLSEIALSDTAHRSIESLRAEHAAAQDQTV